MKTATTANTAATSTVDTTTVTGTKIAAAAAGKRQFQ
jgi:hypothetical protein